MTAGRACLALAVLLAAGCKRKTPAYQTLPEPLTRFELSAGAKDAAAGVDAAVRPRFIQQVVPGEVSALIAAGHAHPAVASLEAAGCDLALVTTGASFDRLLALGHQLIPPGIQTATPKPIDDPGGAVVYCASQSTTSPPPDCAAIAPIFVRVARPKRRFHVLSGLGVPPVAPRCSGIHDAKGKLIAGEGPGYPSAH